MIHQKRTSLIRLAALATLPWTGWRGAGLAQEKPLRVGPEGLEDAGPARAGRGERSEKPPRSGKKEGPPTAVPSDDELPF